MPSGRTMSRLLLNTNLRTAVTRLRHVQGTLLCFVLFVMSSVTGSSVVHSVCDAQSTLPLTFPDDYHPPPSLINGASPDFKSHISKSSSTAGSVSTLRLLLKGKALQDNKLVKDYDIQDGSTITIMSNPAAPPLTAEPTSELPGLSPSPSAQVDAPGGSPGTYQRHQCKLSDIPAVLLPPAGSPGQTTPLLPAQSLPLPPNPSYSPTHTPIALDLNAFPIPSPSTPEQTRLTRILGGPLRVLANPVWWEDRRC